MREPLRVVPSIGVARQLDTPVRELEHERVPPLRAPVFCHPRALQDEVLLAELFQVIAYGEAGLAPAHNNGFDALHHKEQFRRDYSGLSPAARAASRQSMSCC